MKTTTFNLLLVIIFILTLNLLSYAQSFNEKIIQYISPVPGSKLNSTETNIIIKFLKPIGDIELETNHPLIVTGEKSRHHSGKIILSENNKTLLFYSDKKYEDGEIITVELKENLKTISGETIPGKSFSFETSHKDLNKDIWFDPLKRFYRELSSNKNSFNDIKKFQSNYNGNDAKIRKDLLPDDFPQIIVDSHGDPSPGHIFLAPFIISSNPTYLIITDNYGMPIFYRKTNGLAFDFKKQTTGVLTYFETGSFNQYYVMDDSYNIIDSLSMQNGYPTDLHELIILENGHSLMMSYDHQQVSMDTVVPGGNPEAEVIGLIIQELDENKNVVFQWRSWDHFQITDATYDFDLTDSLIDYAHGNAIEMDYDGNLLISSRNMDEITKIDKNTGEIIWRLGGQHCKNNQFSFINDPIGFSHQHDIRRLPNGNIMLFDNGNLHDPPFSRVAEYQLDEENKLAFLVWEHRNDPSTFSGFMGSARRLENHNTVIGWGSHTMPAISEVHPDGTTALSFSFPDSILNYRAFKFPWKTNLFVANTDSLDFGFVPVGDMITEHLEIINNSNQELEINGLFNRNESFQINSSLPIIISAFSSLAIEIVFNPKEDGEYFDELHIRKGNGNELIAQVVSLSGTTNPITSTIEDGMQIFNYYLSQNYPNPFNPATKIKYSIPPHQNPLPGGARGELVTLKIYDVLGNEVATLVNEEKSSGEYEVEFDASNLSSGIYFYQIKTGNFSQIRKMILMK